ncbi:MAG TPA: EamA family transporter [Gammaproteobacteria bacterium]|nr:EamA family transporter [Gammaproteobacteria bacterium]
MAFDAAAFSRRSILAFLYLMVFGSIVAFTAYVWLLRVSTPARVSTYAYVNPVVAVFLGWAMADEALTMRMLVAAAVIVSGVVLITLAPKQAVPLTTRSN